MVEKTKSGETLRCDVAELAVKSTNVRDEKPNRHIYPDPDPVSVNVDVV